MADKPTYKAGTSGICPHCGRETGFLKAYVNGEAWPDAIAQQWSPAEERQLLHRAFQEDGVTLDKLEVSATRCSHSDCAGIILTVTPLVHMYGGPAYQKMGRRDMTTRGESHLIWPRHGYIYVDPQVPEHVARDYREATAILEISPNASAAFARRCLHTVLQEASEVTEYNLQRNIEALLKLGTLPPYILENLDMIRQFGNDGAHPNRSEHTGEIIDVEPGEARLTLSVLDALFKHYYIKPQYTVKPDEARQIRDNYEKKIGKALPPSGEAPSGGQPDGPPDDTPDSPGDDPAGDLTSDPADPA